jgi:hypothetical protein
VTITTVGVLLTHLLSGCSNDPVDVGPRATVKEAPTVSATDPVTTQNTTAEDTPIAVAFPDTTLIPATSTSQPASVLVSSIVPGGYVATGPDEAAIMFIADEYQKLIIEQIVARTFDLSVISNIATAEPTRIAAEFFAAYRDGGKYLKWGTIAQSVTVSIVIRGNTAVAINCQRNDVQEWDSLGTAETSDDVLPKNRVEVFALQYDFVKRGGKWLLSYPGDAPSGKACESVF